MTPSRVNRARSCRTYNHVFSCKKNRFAEDNTGRKIASRKVTMKSVMNGSMMGGIKKLRKSVKIEGSIRFLQGLEGALISNKYGNGNIKII